MTLSVCVRCPECGRTFTLADHPIGELGRVGDIVGCPHCPFEAHLILDGWPEGWRQTR